MKKYRKYFFILLALFLVVSVSVTFIKVEISYEKQNSIIEDISDDKYTDFIFFRSNNEMLNNLLTIILTSTDSIVEKESLSDLHAYANILASNLTFSADLFGNELGMKVRSQYYNIDRLATNLLNYKELNHINVEKEVENLQTALHFSKRIQEALNQILEQENLYRDWFLIKDSEQKKAILQQLTIDLSKLPELQIVDANSKSFTIPRTYPSSGEKLFAHEAINIAKNFLDPNNEMKYDYGYKISKQSFPTYEVDLFINEEKKGNERIVFNVGVYDGKLYSAHLTNEAHAEYGIKYDKNMFTFEEGKEKALQIAKDIDPTMDEFKLVHAVDHKETATYTFVPIINNIAVHFKPLEINIRLDTGEFTQFDASSYFGITDTNVTTPERILSIEEARSYLPEHLTFVDKGLFLIYNRYGEKVLTYAFDSDIGTTTFIHVETGKEELVTIQYDSRSILKY
ncbi:PepSY1/2 domain-containing protein [Chengkuizengella axinellae]|uniref:Germination protein YpeB n=1 Tax=Chengkuizengella axinellae TaxID=3064388 RepID=A0ABT9IW17_9BACL|nr:PepSY1/2 domain-containing protein [Chengkuizengella sp. 2205SS18-9]MDP5273532.1 germination protein YpeB [Chengkuizengella sp. 2205SS18-9]